MKYFNVSLLGLSGKLHSAASNVLLLIMLRPHMKMLTGDYFTNEDKSLQSGGSPFCNICSDKTEPESLGHLILRCSG